MLLLRYQEPPSSPISPDCPHACIVQRLPKKHTTLRTRARSYFSLSTNNAVPARTRHLKPEIQLGCAIKIETGEKRSTAVAAAGAPRFAAPEASVPKPSAKQRSPTGFKKRFGLEPHDNYDDKGLVDVEGSSRNCKRLTSDIVADDYGERRLRGDNWRRTTDRLLQDRVKPEHVLRVARERTEEAEKKPQPSLLHPPAVPARAPAAVPAHEVGRLPTPDPDLEPHTSPHFSSVPPSRLGLKRPRPEDSHPASPPLSPILSGSSQTVTTVNSYSYERESTDSFRLSASPILKPTNPQLLPDDPYPEVLRDSNLSKNPTIGSSGPQYRPGASRGDAVLLSFMGPEHPHVAFAAGQSPLPYPGSESPEGMEMGSGQDGEGEGESRNGGGHVSRQPSKEGLNAGAGGEGEGVSNGGASEAGGGGGAGNDGNAGVNGSGSSGDGGDDDKDKDKKPQNSLPDEMEVDCESGDSEEKEEKNNAREEKSSSEKDRGDMKGSDADAMQVESVPSGAAVGLMALRNPVASSLSGQTSTTGDTWAQTPPSPNPSSVNRGPPCTAPSNPLFPTNNLSPKLPSIKPPMNAQSSNSTPSTHPPVHDGRHTTLPPINSIDLLADAAQQQSTQQQGTAWNDTPHMATSRAAHTTASTLYVAPSSRPPTTQAPPSATLPPPAQPPHSYGTEGKPRPPIHHMTREQRMYHLSGFTHYYPQHPHQHYQTSFHAPIQEAPQPTVKNGSLDTYANPNFVHRSEFSPTLQSHSPPNNTNFFAAHEMPGRDGRRESAASAEYQGPGYTPTGPSTGETMRGSDEPGSTTSPESSQQIPAQQPPQGPLAGGGFRCEYPGCKAPPFQTQYLLNSHANVHSSNRPHYCPVKGCSRAEGGKGFKRKNEMIRHGLVHDSPGYICPFCRDREHKYPRPDNLQRHVRVHHVDKDKDDPLLRDVLAQRPEGGNRGRRRRLGA